MPLLCTLAMYEQLAEAMFYFLYPASRGLPYNDTEHALSKIIRLS